MFEPGNQTLVKACLLCRYFVQELKKRTGFYLLHEVIHDLRRVKYISALGLFFFILVYFLCDQPEFLNICFWFIPPSLRGKEGNPDYQEKLGKVSF